MAETAPGDSDSEVEPSIPVVDENTEGVWLTAREAAAFAGLTDAAIRQRKLSLRGPFGLRYEYRIPNELKNRPQWTFGEMRVRGAAEHQCGAE